MEPLVFLETPGQCSDAHYFDPLANELTSEEYSNIQWQTVRDE